jgi:hypothetical protein
VPEVVTSLDGMRAAGGYINDLPLKATLSICKSMKWLYIRRMINEQEGQKK